MRLSALFGVAFGCWGGTSFLKADLTCAVFSKATLKSTNFNVSKNSHTRLNHVDWTEAKHLNRAKVDGSILTNRAVRELLVTRRGYGKNYFKANLSSANLIGVDLDNANLTRADLSNALLCKTHLKDATFEKPLFWVRTLAEPILLELASKPGMLTRQQP